MESGFNADTGTSADAGRLFNRTSKVGLSGGFGSVEFGRQYTQIFQLIDGFDAQGTSKFSTTNAIGSHSLAHSDRWDNSVVYTAPGMGGFTAAAQYAFGENATATTSAGRAFGLSAGYANGPVAVKAAYENVKATGPSEAAKTVGLAASYDFGVVKLLAQLVNQKDGLATGVKDQGAVLGLMVPMGAAGNVNVAYGREKAEYAATGMNASKATSFGVEYLYSLSKRTTVYAALNSYKYTDLDALVETTTRNRVYGLGIRHKF